MNGQAPGPAPTLHRVLSLRDLVLFNIAAVIGIRWLAAAAHAGSGSLLLWLLADILFFIPSAIVVSALSARFPEEGGFYIWTKHAFGDWHGFLCGWCYWCSNLFYFPTLILVGVGVALYILGPAYARLSENHAFMLPAALVVLWVALLTNLVGLSVGKWTANIGGVATYAAGALLVCAGIIVWFMHGSATPFRVLPEWSWQKVNFWSQIAFAFVGLELAAVMGGEILSPRRNVPRAAWISGAAVTGLYVAGTAAILVLLPPERVSIVTGLAQAGDAAALRLGLWWISPLLALLVALGVIGQLAAWVAGAARIPFAIGLDRYLPPAFGKLHPRWRTPHVSLLIQGLACTLLLAAMQLGESVRVSYQLLVDMMVITTLIPFVYIFLTAWKFGHKISASSGLLVTFVSLMVSVIPPDEVASRWLFELKIVGGCALVALIGRMFFKRGVKSTA